MTSIGTYGFINAKVRAMKSFLLTDSIYRTMAASRSLEELFVVLSQTHFRNMVERVKFKEPLEIELELVSEEIRRLRVIEKNSRGNVRQLVVLFLERYDGDKLKTLLRGWHQREGKEPRVLREKIVYDFPVNAIVSAETLEEIVTLLEGTPFQKVLSREISTYMEHKSLFPLELAIDRDFFARTWEATESLSQKDQRIARRLLGIEIDLRNIDWIGRFRRYYNVSTAEVGGLLLPHGYRMGSDDVRHIVSGGSVSKVLAGITREAQSIQRNEAGEGFDLYGLERALYQILLSEAGRAFGEFPFTIGSILGYLILLRIETKNVRTLLQAKLYGLSSEQAEDLLVL